jgi:predicted nucleic acid-binding protein
MTYKLFLDSDVVIDFFSNREPHVSYASNLFELNEKGTAVLYVSALSINNIYYILKKGLGHKKALDIVEILTEITVIIGVTKNEILKALKNDFTDYEDSMQYSSALTIKGLDAIITRNIKDYKNSDIAVMTPLNFLKFKLENEN